MDVPSVDHEKSAKVVASDGQVLIEHATGICERDIVDLARWGKRQQLKRDFSLFSIIGLTCVLMITWESSLAVFAGGLANGGPGGLVYAFLFAWVGNIFQALVMAEMGSMMPLAGGQYNWVAILAPPSCSKFLSYLTGWITFISWQAVSAAACYIGGTIIQGLLILKYPDTYTERSWHGALLSYVILLLSLFVNTAVPRLLPYIDSFYFIMHIAGFFAILVPLVYFAPHGSASDVFETFANRGGWSSDALSWFVGLSSSMATFIGIDAATHMAEEIKGAAVIIPRSMFISVAVNGVLGFAMLIAVLFCLGDLDSVLNTATGYPYIQIFYNATESIDGAIAMSSVIVAAQIFAAMGVMTAASRMTWAFAREKALPGSILLSRVNPRLMLPLYSIALTAAISLLLILITLGSETAFNSFVSLVIAGFYSSYMLAASVLLHRRLTGAELKYGPFRLGRWQIPVIILSLIYTAIGIFFSFWPPAINPTPQTMNWSVVVFGGAVVLSLVFWLVHGRKVYNGPIMEVRLS